MCTFQVLGISFNLVSGDCRSRYRLEPVPQGLLHASCRILDRTQPLSDRCGTRATPGFSCRTRGPEMSSGEHGDPESQSLSDTPRPTPPGPRKRPLRRTFRRPRPVGPHPVGQRERLPERQPPTSVSGPTAPGIKVKATFLSSTHRRRRG